jgi:hypothetical protein
MTIIGDTDRKKGGHIPLGKPRRRWEHNIGTYFREMEWGGVDWTGLD